MSLTASEASLNLPPRFAKIKQNLIIGKEDAVVASWARLLDQLRSEIDHITKAGPAVIPSIDFQDIQGDSQAREFSRCLRKRGVGVIRGVVSGDTIDGWVTENEEYISHNGGTRDSPFRGCHPRDMYWSPAQIKARACPNVLAAQAFLLNLWQTSDPEAALATNFPTSYADRLHMEDPDDCGDTSFSKQTGYMDGGSVERWETDGYGVGSTYQNIWDGRWEEYNPWDSSTRLKISTNLYNSASACSMFRMFNGYLCLNNGRPPGGESPLRLCPMLQLTTAYVLLRPFFSPVHSSPGSPAFLSADNWILERPFSSAIQGAAPSFRQELSDALHPHLRLSESMIQVPALSPGDYLVWHCDSISSPTATITTTSNRGAAPRPTGMYLPACPLTRTNAMYLVRQRRAFLLGQPGPDFDDGARGEGGHMGRPGVQEICDAGGNGGLRAMGLLAWDECDVEDGSSEAVVLEMANNILFPDRHGFDMG
ncbi:hypothetical protein ACRE_037070 [Hapsidospora chrysogenum ATCC 11550]|uniref:Uncharacterized protein n=1 Tax=Hapsidospora chrysogenum (strain ATCC 11550 / CBS 779.69 / DSM 880 / IAM 14645 / JCM 23072 / IMI 49137) TaxID=857340 RepID=A0A086T7Y1_HAPC1|nr:hypothetical protein ACRE_037070 [Hapsidospora chrysogenum ATCC 11550]